MSEEHPAPASDDDLVGKVRAGDIEAFEVLYHRHKGVVFARILSIVGDHNEARELLQETFVTAHAKLASFDGSGSLGGWLRRIALNCTFKGDTYRDSTSGWGLLFRRERENARIQTSIGWTLLYKSVTDTAKNEHSVSVSPLFKYENLAGERAFRIFHYIRIPLGSDSHPSTWKEASNPACSSLASGASF